MSNQLNKSGLDPVGYRVVVKPDKAPDRVGEKKLIIAPDQTKERQGFAMDRGVIVSMGDMAYTYDPETKREWTGRKPQVGDRVFFPRYGGMELKGVDGDLYRMLNDTEIPAWIAADAA